MEQFKGRRFAARLGYACAGIRATFALEASFRTQVALALAAALALALLRPPLVWVALCTLSASAVLALELVNTALERLIDHVHPDAHDAVRIAKDCAAGAVLIASIAALAVGALTLAAGLHRSG